MATVEQKYRKIFLRKRLRQEVAMKSAFIRVAKKFSNQFANNPIIRSVGDSFEFRKNASLNKEFTNLMSGFETDLLKITKSGINDAWDTANDMNDEIVNYYFKGLDQFKAQQAAMMNRNSKALEAFVNRKRNARTLSDRIWQTSNRYRDELEAHLMIGLSEGTSAADMATQIQQYLEQPDNLFRRVRGDDGILRLSAAAKLFHPGEGIYRSSYKNALRVTRTETNAAYRTADQQRWNSQRFIIGYEVKLSAQHPVWDICDELKGVYPKSFLWTGWHPQCFCFVVPIRMNRDDFIKLLNEEKVEVPYVKEMPGNFKKWWSDNSTKIGKMKNKPYFILDNKKRLK